MIAAPLRRTVAGLAMASSLVVSGSAGPTADSSGPMPPDPVLLASARAGDAVASELLFSRDLLAALGREEPGNLVVSAPSVFDVLALLAPGARGATAVQLTEALHAGSTADQLLADTVGLENDLGSDSSTLSLARAAWLQSGFAINPAYAALLDRAAAPPQLVDFEESPGMARQTINSWVEHATRGRIPDLLPDDAVTTSTRLVLTSALALDARWEAPFQHSATAQGPFATPSGQRQVSVMHALAPTDYASGPGYTAVRLPYRGGNLDALIILPDLGADPLSLVPTLGSVTAQMSSKVVALALPRFTVSSSLDLAPAMNALGLGSLFTLRADLSGIGGPPGYLTVSNAVHRAWLSVDEDGTEAAAATGLTVVATAGIAGSPIAFTVDRPFLFVVQDRSLGLPVLVARITDPG